MGQEPKASLGKPYPLRSSIIPGLTPLFRCIRATTIPHVARRSRANFYRVSTVRAAFIVHGEKIRIKITVLAQYFCSMFIFQYILYLRIVKTKYLPGCAVTVNLTLLDFISEAFVDIRNIQLRVVEYVRARTADRDREVKSQYHREVAHNRNANTQEKLHSEFLSTLRDTGVRSQTNGVFPILFLPNKNKHTNRQPQL